MKIQIEKDTIKITSWLTSIQYTGYTLSEAMEKFMAEHIRLIKYYE